METCLISLFSGILVRGYFYTDFHHFPFVCMTSLHYPETFTLSQNDKRGSTKKVRHTELVVISYVWKKTLILSVLHCLFDAEQINSQRSTGFFVKSGLCWDNVSVQPITEAVWSEPLCVETQDNHKCCCCYSQWKSRKQQTLLSLRLASPWFFCSDARAHTDIHTHTSVPSARAEKLLY